MNFIVPTVSLLALTAAQGEVHVHGHGNLMVAVDADGRLEAILEVPAESLWGFEHEARTEADHEAVEAAHHALGEGGLIRFSRAAGCELISSNIEGDAHVGHHDDDMNHDAHHDDRNGQHDAHHEDDHDDEHDDDHGGHQDVGVHYVFACDAPSAIHEISTALFEQFPRLEEIDGVFVDTRRQAGFELSPDQVSVTLPR